MKHHAPSEFHGHRVSLAQYAATGCTFELLVPVNCDRLIDEPAVIARFEKDEYLPYWAQIWPASLLLADAVAAWQPLRGRSPRIIEIGCGLGLVTLVLCHLGYRVLATDCSEDALAFVVENARRNRLPIPETRVLDWCQRYPDLSFDRIIAADVLFETRHLRPVAEFIGQHLAHGGFALLADPNRVTAEDFGTVARHSRLAVDVVPVAHVDPGADNPIRGRLFHLRHTTWNVSQNQTEPPPCTSG